MRLAPPLFLHVEGQGFLVAQQVDAASAGTGGGEVVGEGTDAVGADAVDA